MTINKQVKNFMYFADFNNCDYDAEYFMQYMFYLLINKGDSVIDVGANYGMHTVRLADIVDDCGYVYAFEALPENILHIKNMNLGVQVELMQYAVTNEAIASTQNEITFHRVCDSNGFSGIRQRTDIPATWTVEQITVPTTTLDRTIPADVPVSFIKIDVEGGDFHVMTGARRILEQHKPVVVFESGRQGSAELYGYTRDAFFEFFQAIDYRLYTFTGEVFDKHLWDADNVYWEVWAVHKDSPHIAFFHNNLGKLVACYVSRQLSLFDFRERLYLEKDKKYGGILEKIKGMFR